MYNRYIPRGDFIPAESAEQGGRENRPPRRSGLPGGLFAGVPDLNGLLKMLHLDRFDKGDILLLLVLVYLFIESEDEDWLIVLALVLLMGF